jgi:hypothetical protein
LNPEQFERVSHLLNIHQTLRTTFSTPANLSGFMGMTNDNAPFDGRTPLAMIASGELADLREVAQHIDTFKSGLPRLTAQSAQSILISQTKEQPIETVI